MEFLSQTYIALRGPTGAPQSPADTIARLADRLSPSTLLADRRAAVLSLKGLSRDHKADVADRALAGLLDVLQNDAEIDADIGKAVLETLNILCEVDDAAPVQARELGFQHTDQVLVDDKIAHKLFVLLADNSFYLRFHALQFLATLLQNRRQVVQKYFLNAPVGPTSFVTILEEKREIIRHEAIFVVQSLVSQSPEIQKILAFEGAFERLFNIVASEGGIEGGVVVHDALTCIDALLRFNQSNQSYLRASPLPPLLLSVLGFPPALPPDVPPPQGFALQLWDNTQKRGNAALVVGIIGLLAKSGGSNSQDPLTFVFDRCLLELGLASNFPTAIKTQALHLLPTNFSNFPLAQLSLTPYMPVPDTNGEEWDRLEPASALDALVELVLHGEYNGSLEGERRSKEGMELRAAALGVFQNFVQKEEIAETIVQAMVTPQGSSEPVPVTPLLYALIAPPVAPLRPSAVISTHLASLLFAHLLRASPRAKTLARSIVPPPAAPASAQPQASFFVPADGAPPPTPPDAQEDAEAEEPQSLLQILSEHLSLAFLTRGRADTSDREARDWDRLLVGYLSLLVQWLWENPGAVREFLEAGALSVLVEPINQTADTDAVIPGLCVFLLGECYEFNREPGEITRATIYPILTRLGVDMLIGRITHLRDDDRFKTIGPDTLVLSSPSALIHLHQAPTGSLKSESEQGEMWFDWAFVDFWKSNYYTIQKGITADPNSLSSSAGQGAETAMLVASLRDVIRNQASEIDTLCSQLQEFKAAQIPDDRDALHAQISSLTAEIQGAEDKRREVEKEQEDLLVLLDELNSKRRRDKARMREAGLDVSEDEVDEDGEEDE
ncbi:hypothetical protein AcV5_002123 [Taiwanofungus camphoratus]|nr:hypothetical protein AcV5_002123 [Antrodia cinnamomea]KAI0943953.1 hypothetical protein AcV7_001897 [Antrodia cinnamomea]